MSSCRRLLLSSLLWLLAAFVTSTDAAENVKTLHARRAERSPAVDGKLNEACWKQAQKATRFSVIYRANILAAEQTVGSVV